MTCPQHQATVDDIRNRFDSLDVQLREINAKLGDGKVSFATILLRLRAVECIVYGACSIALLALAGKIVAVMINP